MTRMSERTTAFLAGAVVLVGLVAACGAGEETSGEVEVIDVAPGRTATLTTAYDEVATRRPDSSLGVLPSDFPDALPLYRPASITDFGDENGHRFVLFFSPDEPMMVRQRMARELDRTGWALIDRGGERGTYRRGSHSVILEIREARPGTEIRVEY
jgi:hypothetical protein